ncbi:bifunctional acetate--CoA ligase family protein/GNAT family N-acetyltransferase [Thalassoroseus pseudoceratinae]|uniref:bifunctional acetate--CoA ligase family protein/GNAT family N-acetyltransferase n=1 Tax=Thalassoroseus pseudoceratinae TaxID=2713176 RepID=UPI0014235AE0|nr:bifunctional acetate--CoA ligase family protein/GNAT family N-acetyltransferase [Thalassoroseus pseudoceratinae]
MSIHNLNSIFRPKRVAVIGASMKAGSVGRTVLENLLSGGLVDNEGEPASQLVYPVNPKYDEIFGIPAFADMSELPEPADLAIVCTPAATVPDVVRQCGAMGTMGVIVISAGFREIGSTGRRLEEDLKKAVSEYPGMRMIGPNCLGIISPKRNLNASFAETMPSSGSVAFISQSGALCTSVLDWSLNENVGFSHFVSVGNALDVGFAELIDYFAADGQTEAIVLYIESMSEARRFMSAARAFTLTKPIVVYKAGRFAESAQAAASHTGALAGVDAVYESAFTRAGLVRVLDMESLFDCAELLSRYRVPDGPRLAIVTNAGGPGVMATDALLAAHGKLAELSDSTMRRLDEVLPPTWSHGNPVDVIGDAPPERFEDAVKAVHQDPGVDAVLVVLTPQAMTNPTSTARRLAALARQSGRPVLAAWMGGPAVREGIAILNAAGVPTYPTPEQGVRAFMQMSRYARNRDLLYETPRRLTINFPQPRPQTRQEFRDRLPEGDNILSEGDSKSLLAAYGIPTARPQLATSAEDAVSVAKAIGFPVVLKIQSPDISHKTDVGGVELNLSDEHAVRDAFARVTKAAREHQREARIDGVTIQPMVLAPYKTEIIVGAKKDPVFGPVLMVGAGGTAAEVFRDMAFELPPLTERLARRMVESLRTWPLLAGFRGRPPFDVDGLIDVLLRLSALVADNPEVQELDINPLLLTPDQVHAVDARIRTVSTRDTRGERQFSHLAIRPYPEEFVAERTLRDGTRVRLRPVRPEDVPRWRDLITRCSPESIRRRFRYLFSEPTREVTARFCFCDYDRELSIVAELTDEPNCPMAGVVQLLADADHESAEFGILIPDAWQNNGLGSLLTDYCLDIARTWGLKRVFAEADPANRRVLRLFENRGFTAKPIDIDSTMYHKELLSDATATN